MSCWSKCGRYDKRTTFYPKHDVIYDTHILSQFIYSIKYNNRSVGQTTLLQSNPASREYHVCYYHPRYLWTRSSASDASSRVHFRVSSRYSTFSRARLSFSSRTSVSSRARLSFSSRMGTSARLILPKIAIWSSSAVRSFLLLSKTLYTRAIVTGHRSQHSAQKCPFGGLLQSQNGSISK